MIKIYHFNPFHVKLHLSYRTKAFNEYHFKLFSGWGGVGGVYPICPNYQIPSLQAGGREGSRDYGAETAIFISTLIVLYLLAVVFLVRRQINQVAPDLVGRQSQNHNHTVAGVRGSRLGGGKGSNDWQVFFSSSVFATFAILHLVFLYLSKLWSTVTRQGKTNIRGVASLVEDKNEVLMWNISSPFSHLFRWEVDLFYVLSEYTMILKLQHIFFQETNLEAIIAKLSSTLSHLAIPNVRLEAHQNGLLKRGSDDV